ncbi:glycosyltransferase family 4 protein [Flavobacterium sp.]|uniref:glycosyltransferase family 4 protein n=1 Tax=Flavobacterium sp. TaxID=239 RepID=UPI0039E479DC
MKIVLDPQTYNEQKFGGISRYHTEVFLELQKNPQVQIECPIVYSDNWHLKEAGLFQNLRNKIFNPNFWPKFVNKKISKTYKKANIKASLQKLKKQDFDLFIPTYYSPYFLEALGNKPYVLTVYDMIHEVLPQYFTRDKHTVPNKKRLMEKADKIIAISESTKNDIVKIYPHISADKIEVVYLSYSIKHDDSVHLNLPKKYILFVGNRSDYKNFAFFLKSIAPTLLSDNDLHLVCAGGNPFTANEQKMIADLGVGKKLIQRNFEDHELASYYSDAKCFVFPSEYEGFGIPVLEAMACGCPVVLANHSSFPEVAGEAGVYFELNNEIDLRSKINLLLNDEALRQDYIAKGLVQAQKFSWKKTAQESFEIFKTVVS